MSHFYIPFTGLGVSNQCYGEDFTSTMIDEDPTTKYDVEIVTVDDLLSTITDIERQMEAQTISEQDGLKLIDQIENGPQYGENPNGSVKCLKFTRK